MPKNRFKETQRYNDRIVLITLIILAGSSLVKAITYLLNANPEYGIAIYLLCAAALIGYLIYWLAKLKLKISISEKCVKFKLSPLQSQKQTIPWDEIDNYEIVKTSEIAQWSGGNISFNHERKYSFNGRNGLMIHTKNGESFLIGCKNLSGLQQVLQGLNV